MENPPLIDNDFFEPYLTVFQIRPAKDATIGLTYPACGKD